MLEWKNFTCIDNQRGGHCPHYLDTETISYCTIDPEWVEIIPDEHFCGRGRDQMEADLRDENLLKVGPQSRPSWWLYIKK